MLIDAGKVFEQPFAAGVLLGFAKQKTPLGKTLGDSVLTEPDAALHSPGHPHYPPRKVVSLSGAGWEGVGPPCYGRQA